MAELKELKNKNVEKVRDQQIKLNPNV
jgi:hypothetical protein